MLGVEQLHQFFFLLAVVEAHVALAAGTLHDFAHLATGLHRPILYPHVSFLFAGGVQHSVGFFGAAVDVEHQYLAFVGERYALDVVGEFGGAELLDSPFEDVFVLVGVLEAFDAFVVADTNQQFATPGVGEGHHFPDNLFGMTGF